MPVTGTATPPEASVEAGPSRRLLLVSYYFGPECETGGLRWNGLSRHLAAAGWRIDVLAAARPGATEPYEYLPGVQVYPVPVPTGMGDLVKSIGRVRRQVRSWIRAAPAPVAGAAPAAPPTPTSASAGAAPAGEGLYSRIMGNVGALSRWSAEVGWSRQAVRRGRELAHRTPPSVVAVSSPPHPTQLAGVWLSRALGAPLLADMRDPWLFGELDVVQSKLVDLKCGAWAQRRMLAHASRFVCNTAWAAEALVAHDPSLTGRVTGIPNGSDASPEVTTPDTDHFRVTFIGWLYDFMDPEPVLAACARLRARAGLDALRVEFIGTDEQWGGVSLLERARRLGLADCFEHRRRVPRDEARRLQQRSAVQVVYDAIGPYRVPAKFYDVVQCRGDLLLLGTTPSAMADAAAQVGFTVCTRYVPEEIDAALDRALARWRAGAYDHVLDAHGVFDRVHTARRMAAELDILTAHGSEVPR